MATISVSSTAGLLNALKGARDGDVIQLAAGTYSDVNLRGFTFANVTIQSKDPYKQAVLTDLTVRESSGLTFRNLEFTVDPKAATYTHQVRESKDIHFDAINMHGSLNGSPADDKYGLIIRNSDTVSVINSEFQQLSHALSFLDNVNVQFIGNHFHDLKTDAIRGGGTSNMLVAQNYFTDFYPAAGDHPDAIQFWTNGTTATAENIVVTGNVIRRGAGAAVQGIFFRDQFDTLPYKNVTITNNLVIGTMGNGIMVDGGIGVKIQGNTLVSLPDMLTRIRLEKVDGAEVRDNATSLIVTIESQGVVQSNNTIIGRLAGSDFPQIKSWLDARSDLTRLPDEARVFAPSLGSVILSLQSAAPVQPVAPAPGQSQTAEKSSKVLVGGSGDDNHRVDDVSDRIVEAVGGGTDTVWASVDFTLGANLEVLRLTGDALAGTGNALDNRIIGNAQDNRLSGLAGNDRLQGGDGGDTLFGGLGNDELSGDAGDDKLVGDAGADRLLGGAGADTLQGGEGADWLEGGRGVDQMTGGGGADRFFFRPGDLDKSIDVITDFSSAQGDKIALNTLDANVKTGADDKFAFIGTKAFSGTAGELRYEVKNGVAYVHADTDGDKVADLSIALLSVKSLVAADFIL